MIGQQMITRDRFHRPETETPHPDTGSNASAADEREAEQPGGDEAVVAQAVASRISDSIRLARSPIESACRSTPTSSVCLDIPGSQRTT